MPRKLTRHMLGILFYVYDREQDTSKTDTVRPVGLIAHALVSLAANGYLTVGKTVSLTREGRKLVESGIITRPDPVIRTDWGCGKCM